jgi:hypothetical protein
VSATAPVGLYARDLQELPPDEMLQDFPAGLVAHPPQWAWRMLLPSVGYGRCYLCRAPWWIANPHSVNWGFQGQFALCSRCWENATIQQRVQAHAWVTACWTVDEHAHWPVIEAAVRIDGNEGELLVEILGEKVGREYADLAAEGCRLILGKGALTEVAARLPREPGTWQDRHVHQVVTRLRYQLDLTFDQVKVDHTNVTMGIAGSDQFLTGPATVITWDNCRDVGLRALVFSPYGGWFLRPLLSEGHEVMPLIPRGGDVAPPPSVITDEVIVMLAGGPSLWPR